MQLNKEIKQQIQTLRRLEQIDSKKAMEFINRECLFNK